MLPLKTAINGTKRFSETGFTLLEILVSLFIIAIVFVSIFRLQARTINLADAGNFHTMAPYLARIILSTPSKELLDTTELSGDFSPSHPDWSWHLTVKEFEVIDEDLMTQAMAKQLKQLIVEVSRGGMAQSVSTWRYVPHD